MVVFAVLTKSVMVLLLVKFILSRTLSVPGPYSTIGSESDCTHSGREFEYGTVPSFRGDWSSTNYTVILLLPLNQEELVSVTRESMCTKYWLNAYQSLPRNYQSCWLWRKTTNRTHKKHCLRDLRFGFGVLIYHMTSRLRVKYRHALKPIDGKR